MKITPETQLAKIVQFVDQHGYINTQLAFSELGVTRLAARVLELKGSEFALKPIKSKTLNGNFVDYVPDVQARCKAISINVSAQLMADMKPRATGQHLRKGLQNWITCVGVSLGNEYVRAA